ncbi:hypothetical protein BHE74_00021879 [Ensete ventricosum]|nr:hypothetical protein GW17_00046260 [Ensete ventricosum]RWW70463.1 hypothetical protein BHE74_00021879 [Ensete ventricosum]
MERVTMGTTIYGDCIAYWSNCVCYSCGLWVLFHSLSVRVGDGESNLAFTAICEFIQNFFICDECRNHFHEMSSRYKIRHFFNFKNFQFLIRVYLTFHLGLQCLSTGDPRFPKITWPPKQLCPSCYLSYSRESNGTENIEWDEDEVFQFLVRYYGRTIASSKEATLSSGDDAASTYDIASSTNAVTVPVGAALAIAVASCAFGALACFWRTQQKNRNNTIVLFKKVIYFVITANVSGTEKVGTERIKNKSTITSMN